MHARVHDPQSVLARHGQRAAKLAQYLHRSDPQADALIDAISARGGHRTRMLFERALKEGLGAVRAGAPQALVDFFEHVEDVPPWVDWERIDAGGRVFLRAGLLSGFVLGVKSLIYGYAAPAGNKPLIFSGRLEKRTARRLNETSRFVQAVVDPGGMHRFGHGFEITVRVRLMHAQVRRMLERSGRWDTEAWATPINQHDMVATILLFSSILLQGLRTLGLRISVAEAEDYMHLWRYVGHVIGVDDALLPTTEAEARWLQELIFEMQGPPDDDSRALTQALLQSPLLMATDEPSRRRAQRQVDFSAGLCRGLIGDELADALGVDRSAWVRSVDVMRAVVGTLESVRQKVPWLEEAAVRAGQRHWAHVVALGLADSPATFEFQHTALEGRRSPRSSR